MVIGGRPYKENQKGRASETGPSTTPSQVSTLESNQIVSGQTVENTLQLNKQDGGRIDIPLPENAEEEIECSFTTTFNNKYSVTTDSSTSTMVLGSKLTRYGIKNKIFTIRGFYISTSMNTTPYRLYNGYDAVMENISMNLNSLLNTIKNKIGDFQYSIYICDESNIFNNGLIYILNITSEYSLSNGAIGDTASNKIPTWIYTSGGMSIGGGTVVVCVIPYLIFS